VLAELGIIDQSEECDRVDLAAAVAALFEKLERELLDESRVTPADAD
jgi:hypothetical protein